MTQLMGPLAAEASFVVAASSSLSASCEIFHPQSCMAGRQSGWNELYLLTNVDSFQAEFSFPVLSGWEAGRQEWTLPGMDYISYKFADRDHSIVHFSLPARQTSLDRKTLPAMVRRSPLPSDAL